MTKIDALTAFLKDHGIRIGGYSWEGDQGRIICQNPVFDTRSEQWDMEETHVPANWTAVRDYLGY